MKYIAMTKPLIEGVVPDGRITSEGVRTKCSLDCSKVGYCLLFSSTPVGGVVLFRCPKTECVNFWNNEMSEEERLKYPDYSRT